MAARQDTLSLSHQTLLEQERREHHQECCRVITTVRVLWLIAVCVLLVVISTPDALASFERALGLTSKKLTIPSFLGRPGIDLPLLYGILILLLIYLGGPRAVLPLLAVAYFLATSTRQRD